MTAFLLPSKEALIALHKNAHGVVPTLIIEVQQYHRRIFLGHI